MLFEPIYNLRLIYDFFFKSLQKQYHGVPEKKDINQKAQCANKTQFLIFSYFSILFSSSGWNSLKSQITTFSPCLYVSGW